MVFLKKNLFRLPLDDRSMANQKSMLASASIKRLPRSRNTRRVAVERVQAMGLSLFRNSFTRRFGFLSFFFLLLWFSLILLVGKNSYQEP